MEIATEAKPIYNTDLTEDALFDALRRLRKTDNILLICSLMDYPRAKDLLKSHPEFRLRAVAVPNLPKCDGYSWLVIDLNDLQAIYGPGA